MPIYEQTYRSYEGTLRPHFRWMTMVRQEWRVLLTRRMFIFLVLMGNFHFLLRVLQVYVLDVLSKQSGGLFVDAIAGAQFEDIGAWIYFDFLRMQSPLIFITLIYAGSDLICNDFRNNLMEIFFSKPLNWRDYVMGKVMTLVSIGMALTALPALFMALLHVLFVPTLEELGNTLLLVVPTIGFSLVLVLSFSLAILASSALINSTRFAAIAVFMIAFIDITVGALLAVLTGEGNYLTIAFPVSLNHLGEFMFQETRYVNPIDVPWPGPALFVLAVCGVSLAFICRKVREAEIGR